MKKIATLILAVIVLICISGTAKTSNMEALTMNNPHPQENFELNVKGSTGYGVIDLVIRNAAGKQIGTAPAGQMFTITGETDSRFWVQFPDGMTGTVSKTYTMVNLPDLIPSIRYNASNSYSSLFRSCEKPLELTGTSLYAGKTENRKLGYEEYNMPVLYSMAKKIAHSQAAALSEGYTLVLYEGFRPLEVQKAVCADMQTLMDNDKIVSDSINSWGKSWFIAKGVSNHQQGYAIDVSLAKITGTVSMEIDGQNITVPDEYKELKMPTAMHELSPAAAALSYGVSSRSDAAWRGVPAAEGMTEGAKLLQQYCVAGGLTPLSSEWWHFNDLEARSSTNAVGSGDFYITGNVSVSSN